MKEILVYADWSGLPEIMKIGKLRSDVVRGQEIFSFEYDKSWINSGFAQELDPDLKLLSGRQYIRDNKPNFGLFMDSSPDRWGRMLMDRKEALIAYQGRRKPIKLTESDYLLEVSDASRMGALRFKLDEEGEFLASQDFPIPPMTSIRELGEASLNIEDDDFFTKKDAHKWLKMLMAPGSSLGGARPKASVVDPDENLWIAKFPAKNDTKDSGIWESLVNKLAIRVGINIAEAKAMCYSGKQHTFLTKRFDRKGKQRIHFASAMTLLGYKDGYGYRDGGSYIELLELIEQYGAEPNEDIRELWRRIVFSVAISNTDDHLRNHGFLLIPKGWKLSPAYDINPNENSHGLSLNISENANDLNFDLCMSVIKNYRWNEKEAIQQINHTKSVVSDWKKLANKMNIAHTEQVMMDRAFNV